MRPPLPLVLIVAQVADGTVRTGPPPQRTLGLLVGHCPPKTKLTAVHSWCRQPVISLFCLCKDIKRQIIRTLYCNKDYCNSDPDNEPLLN